MFDEIIASQGPNVTDEIYFYPDANFTGGNSSNATYEYYDEDESGIKFAYKVGDFLTHFYTPALVLFGSIGNILSVIVFFKTKLKKLSSSYYLAALGITDTCFLIVAFISWLSYINVNIYNQNYYCQVFTYVSGVCSFLSVWLVVAFTVERSIAVLYPLKRQTMCTAKRACFVLVGLFLLGCVICVPYLIYAVPIYSDYLKDYVCDVKTEYKFHMKIFNYIDTVIVFVIPFIVIVILNILTTIAVWKVAGVRRTMTMQISRDLKKRPPIHCSRVNYPRNANGQIHQCHKYPKRSSNSSQMKVTKMLLIVSTVFVCLNLPSYIMRIKAFLIESDAELTEVTVMTQYISWFFFMTNFGINFLLYCLSGQNFRKALIGMFKKEQSRLPDVQFTQVTVSEYIRRSNSTSSSRRHAVVHSESVGCNLQELQNAEEAHQEKMSALEESFA